MPNDLEAALAVLAEKMLNLEVQVRILEGVLVNQGITTPKELVDAHNTIGPEEFEKIKDIYEKDFQKRK